MPIFLDLFAGAGGLSEGFIQAGFSPVAHIEMDKAACNTLKTRAAFHWLNDNGNRELYNSYLARQISRQAFYDAMRGFNIWRWDESSITPELYETPRLTSDKKNRNCAQRKVQYIHIDGLASSEAMKALAARREDSQTQSAQIMKMYEELYSLAFLALRETTPFTPGDLVRADQVLSSAAATIEKEKTYISEEMYNNYRSLLWACSLL